MAEFSTYGDIVTTVYGMIRDTATSRRLASTDQIDIWANSLMSELAEHAGYMDLTVETTLTSGLGADISVAAGLGVMGITRVEIDDEAIEPISTRQLYANSRSWQEQTGEPRYYYMDSMRASTSDSVHFGLWPLAGASYDLRVVVNRASDELDYASPADKVMLPLWATPGLVWGILSKFYESESRMQNLKAAKFYRMLFEDMMTRLRVRSYSRLNLQKAYGQGRDTRFPSGDFRLLIPDAGIPIP